MDFFFDTHAHLTLKNQFSKNGGSTSPWKAITKDDLKSGLPLLLKIFALGTLDKTFSSQSSADLLIKSGYKLVVMPLFAPDLDLVKCISSKKVFVSLLRKHRKSRFGEVLNYERYLSLGKEKNAFSILENDFTLLDLAHPQNLKIKFLNDKSDYSESKPEELQIVFSVEGSHCFRSDMSEKKPEKILLDIEQNLQKLLNRGAKIIMVNLTHIDNGNQVFCNQAYAMDGMRVNNFREEPLRPIGNGLTETGEKMIELLDSKGICTDVKHMSYQTRKQFYAYRKEKGLKSPIVSSHSGFTGIWFNSESEKIEDYIYLSRKEKKQYRVKLGKVAKHKFSDLYPKVCFNLSSINLFNEDIREIYDSDGLIGISLDERILGYTRAFKNDESSYSENVGIIQAGEFDEKRILTDTDFYSIDEYTDLGLLNSTKGRKLNEGIDAENLIDMIMSNSNNIPHFQFFHFLNHVLHCVFLGHLFDGADGIEKMLTKTICIGSDFDGLIEAIDWCTESTEISNIKKRFIRSFPEVLMENNLFLPNGLTIEKVADRIFFENGRDFVLSRL